MCKQCKKHNPAKFAWLEPDEVTLGKPSSHGKGKSCTKCGSRKDTKKVGNKFLCESCRDKNDE